MDFMFEDEVDEVGSDVEAYCPKCKGDTTHVVISKYEDEIRRVQCNPCGDVHSYRKPRGDVEEDVPEPVAAKKRALLKKASFDEFFAKHSDKNAKPYNFSERYTENVIVTHPKFGRGFVTELLSDSKVEITFKDSRRVLVHNRKDMPGLPLAAEGDGMPSGSKGARGKAAAAKAAALAAAKAAAAKVPAKPLQKESATVGAAKNANNRAKVPLAKSPPAAKPVAAKPVAAKPVAAKPVATKPVAAKPVAAKRTAKPARAVRPVVAPKTKTSAKPVKKPKGKK